MRHNEVDKACAAQVGLELGEGFEIKIGRMQISWVPVGGRDEEK